LYVKPEDPGTIKKISDFIGIQISASAAASPLYTVSVLGLFALTIAMLLWYI
jgi:hypothetical protein